MNFIKKVLRHFGLLGVERPHIIDQLCPLKNHDLAYLVLRNLNGNELCKFRRISKLVNEIVTKIEQENKVVWNVTQGNYEKAFEKSGIHYIDVTKLSFYALNDLGDHAWTKVEDLILDFGRCKARTESYDYVPIYVVKWFPNLRSFKSIGMKFQIWYIFGSKDALLLEKVTMISSAPIAVKLFRPLQLSVKCGELYIYQHVSIGNIAHELDVKKLRVIRCTRCKILG